MAYSAYFITWTTYGTWLSGDSRGWVKAGALGVQAPDPELEDRSRQSMTEPEVLLTREQRDLVEQTIRDHCEKRRWPLHAASARTNHVHVVVTADCHPDDVMNQLKAWCSRKLSDQAGLKTPVAKKAGRRHWFTEGGDKEEIESEMHLENTIRYVMEGQ